MSAGSSSRSTTSGARARITRANASGRWRMLRAADPGKDQTYALYMASQEQLAHTLWPVGEHPKARIREMANCCSDSAV